MMRIRSVAPEDGESNAMSASLEESCEAESVSLSFEKNMFAGKSHLQKKGDSRCWTGFVR